MDEMLAPRPELPAPVRDFIFKLTAENRAPAYLLVDDRSVILESGGELAEYGLDGFQPGVVADQALEFVAGLLPLEQGNIFLPFVKLDHGPYSDVYIFAGERGTWVLLLNATREALKRQNLQQRAYDLSLETADLRREGSELQQAKSELEQRVSERTADLADANRRLLEELARRKQAEAELRESEARFRRIFDSNMIGIMFWDLSSHRITDANNAFLDMLGYSREDLRAGGLNWESVSGGENSAADKQAFALMAEYGACAPYTRQFARRDGSPATLLFGAALLTGSQNKIVCFTLDLSKYK
jgi:PAS domain S-box-containing protein